MTSGEEFEDLCERIVQAANGLQVRRRAFEEIDPENRGRLLGLLRLFSDDLIKAITNIDAELSEILDAKIENG